MAYTGYLLTTEDQIRWPVRVSQHKLYVLNAREKDNTTLPIKEWPVIALDYFGSNEWEVTTFDRNNFDGEEIGITLAPAGNGRMKERVFIKENASLVNFNHGFYRINPLDVNLLPLPSICRHPFIGHTMIDDVKWTVLVSKNRMHIRDVRIKDVEGKLEILSCYECFGTEDWEVVDFERTEADGEITVTLLPAGNGQMKEKIVIKEEPPYESQRRNVYRLSPSCVASLATMPFRYPTVFANQK